MSERRLSNTTILAKIGTTYGTDAVPTGGANAMLVSDVTINPLEASNQDRNNIRAYMGAEESLSGPSFKSLNYSVELVGSGTKGTAPAWGALLRACGFAQTVTADTRVDYLPVSTGFEWVDQYYFADGVLHKLLGCRGTVSLDMSSGVIPKLKYQFRGLDGGISTASPSGVDYSGWKTPEVVTNANTLPLLRGCTHSATGDPALSGGTTTVYNKFMLDMGIEAPFMPFVGQESVEITKRKITGDLEVALSASEEVALMANVKANTLVSLGLQHGLVEGRRSLIFARGVQLTSPAYSDVNGKLMNTYKTTLVPSGTGNDELRIVTSF